MRRISADEFSTRKHAAQRQAFTLIELMIVVVVIATLMALLLPAINGVFVRARISQVATEIRGLESAIAQFKALYGVEPPSGITIYEAPAGWTADPGSMEKIRRIWPSFNFRSGRDLNQDGDYTDSFTLSGSECLVFFLGGGVSSVGGGRSLTGFSKNPTNPFSTAASGEVREGPFFEFKSSRLRPSPKSANAGLLVYLDTLPSQASPYLYISSYDGRGYQSTADLVAGTSDDLNDVYRQGFGPTAVAQKQKSFQIVSPGADGQFGYGGRFDPSLPNHGLSEDLNGNGTLDSGEDLNGNGTLDLFKFDFDNITNFHSGRLID